MPDIAHWRCDSCDTSNGPITTLRNDSGEAEFCDVCGAPVEYLVPIRQLRGAVEALRKYGYHDAGCASLRGGFGTLPACDCGWHETSSQLLRGQ